MRTAAACREDRVHFVSARAERTVLDPQTIEDLVATRDLAGSWPNSNLFHEGALLSFAPSQQDYARSRLRSATAIAGGIPRRRRHRPR